MEEGNMPENHLTSAAAFVEGGIQEVCDDACSICLEAFCDSDPSTLTSCRHEYHLQCILEWCQRSSRCPMCWQSISLKDPGSQELLDAVEHERNIRMNPPRNTTIFHHPTLGDFELQHLPVNASESDLEEHILQHLAAAAAMGRARQIARREGHRNRSSAQGRPHFLVFSTNPSGTSAASSVAQIDGDSGLPPTVTITSPNSPLTAIGEDSIERPSSALTDRITTTTLGSSAGTYHHRTAPVIRTSPVRASPNSQDRAGPSDLQSFSDSLKSRISALSTRYKESITKSTRGWKERLFARNSLTTEPSTEARTEPNHSAPTPPVITSVSRMMDHLQIAPGNRTNTTNTPTASTISEEIATPNSINQQTLDSLATPSNDEVQRILSPVVAAAAASSASG